MARTSAIDVSARREQILEHLQRNAFMGVSDLSTLLGVSDVTIRRDLDALHQEGKISRRHGGAVSVTSISSASAGEAPEESPSSPEAVQRIARHALTFLDTGDVVLLSSGEISEELAGMMTAVHDLTVITNSAVIFDILRSNHHIHLVSTGGELRHPRRTLVGPLAEASIREIRADKFLLEPSGISLDRQLYCSSLADVPVLQAMIHAAREVVVLAEHATFKKEGIMTVASLDVAAKLVSGYELEEEIAGTLRQEGIEVVTI